jgi:hypothetical protein
MPILEHASSWPGLARLAALSCVTLTGLLGGCASQPLFDRSRSTDELEFLDRALSGGPATREAMWRDTVAGGHASQEAQLRLALLESVPEHSGSDPAAAQRALRGLLAQSPPQDIAAVARLRLDELKSNNQCVGETQELRRRLAQVVNIERELDSRGN